MNKFNIGFPSSIRYFLEDIDFMQSSLANAIKDLALAVCGGNCILWGCNGAGAGAVFIDGEVYNYAGGTHQNKFSISAKPDPTGERDGQNPRVLTSVVADDAGTEISRRFDSIYTSTATFSKFGKSVYIGEMKVSGELTNIAGGINVQLSPTGPGTIRISHMLGHAMYYVHVQGLRYPITYIVTDIQENHCDIQLYAVTDKPYPYYSDIRFMITAFDQ